jgi:TPR repeat protein
MLATLFDLRNRGDRAQGTVVALALALLLSACSGEAIVPPVAVETPPEMKPIPGSYAAAVVAGRWNLKTTSDQFLCSTWTVEAQIDPSYRKTMQTALDRALEQVTFVPAPLTPDQLKAQGYSGQIVIGQHAADSSFVVDSTLFHGAIRSDVDLSAIVAVQGADATVHQQIVSARGRGQSKTSYCSTIDEAISAAAQDALASVARQVVLYVQNDLNARRLAEVDSTKSAPIETEALPPVAAPPLSAPSQAAPAQDAPTYMLPRELLEPTPPADEPNAKERELQRDLERERPRGDAGANSKSSTAGAAESPSNGDGHATTQGAALLPLTRAPSSLTPSARPDGEGKGATVAPIAPGANTNAARPKAGAGDRVDAKQAFQRATDAAAGRGVPQSDAEAVKWFRIAADQGYAPAENDLGFLYAEGRGVARDDAEAVKWYRRAADQNFPPAQTSLGMMYAQGRGVAQSDFDALAFYSAAANEGYPQAKANLAEMYASGRGVPRDERTASFLLKSVNAKPLTGSGIYVESPLPVVQPAVVPGQ